MLRSRVKDKNATHMERTSPIGWFHRSLQKNSAMLHAMLALAVCTTTFLAHLHCCPL
jgi:hypothetical protein